MLTAIFQHDQHDLGTKATGLKDIPRASLRRRQRAAGRRWRLERVVIRLDLALGRDRAHEDPAISLDDLMNPLLDAFAAGRAAHVFVETLAGVKTDRVTMPRADDAWTEGAIVFDISVQ